VIVATCESQQDVVLGVIRELGLELQVIFNKGALMVLPSGVDKATGLAAALDNLRLSPHNCVGIGDAENDHAFLSLCGCSVVVANALPALKATATLVTDGARGAGVRELVDRLLATDLDELDDRLSKPPAADPRAVGAVIEAQDAAAVTLVVSTRTTKTASNWLGCSMTERTWWETVESKGGELLDRLKQLIAEGNVRRVVVKQEGRVVAEFPLSVGVVGTVLAPIAAAIGALVALLAQCTIEVERTEGRGE
jgi:hypothetical protein